MDLQTLLFSFLGGLGIFLFGIKSMGDGLQKVAGERLRNLLDRFTTNPIMGVIAGIIVTALIQTSSGTTVLTIGLVNAGFMTLKQAIGVIMGANIGTTTTAFIIGIKITTYSLPILFVGAALLFFFKNKLIHHYGQVIFGFGALFYGLNLMGVGLKPLGDLQLFKDLTLSMSEHPLLGVLIGTLFTICVQSSSAAIGLLQSLFEQGAISLDAALPVLFGDNIGTTITAVLAAIGASVTAKRAALTHVIFNVIGTIIVLIVLGPFTKLIMLIQESLSLNPSMTIAFAHGIFNVSNTIIQLPFIAILAIIVTKLVPGEEFSIEYRAQHLDPRFIGRSPSIALGQAKEEVVTMCEFAEKGLAEAALYLQNGQKRHAEMAIQYENAINNLDRKITDYLIQISSRSLSGHDSTMHSMLMNTVRDIERIGDHMENIIELKDYQLTNKVPISESAYEDIEEMFTLVIASVQEAKKALEEDDIELANDVKNKETAIDKLERSLRKKHILRVNEGKCTGSAGIVFVDILSNLERIGDHASNIAQAVIDEDY